MVSIPKVSVRHHTETTQSIFYSNSTFSCMDNDKRFLFCFLLLPMVWGFETLFDIFTVPNVLKSEKNINSRLLGKPRDTWLNKPFVVLGHILAPNSNFEQWVQATCMVKNSFALLLFRISDKRLHTHTKKERNKFTKRFPIRVQSFSFIMQG